MAPRYFQERGLDELKCAEGRRSRVFGIGASRRLGPHQTIQECLEGRGGRRYPIRVRTPRRLGEAADVSVRTTAGGDQELEITFTGPAAEYVRRDISIPLR